jgi:flagellar protein FliL
MNREAMAADEKDDPDEKEPEKSSEGADEGAPAEGEEGTPRKGKRKLIIIAAALLVLLLAAGGAYFFFFSGGGEEEKAEGEDGEVVEIGEDGKPILKNQPVFYEMPEILVNLNSSNTGKPSFLKMKVTLELSGANDVPVIEGYMPRITDSFNTYARELRPTDLAGSAGLYRLREELLLRINQMVAPAKVNNILFKEILIQ